jgi:beta-lactamase regulating signal transducer with metallopeptidase domain
VNLLHLILESSAVHRLGVTLLHSLWEGAVIAAALFIAGFVLRRSAPAARYSASCAALLLMVLAPLCTYLLTNAPANAVAIAPNPQLPAEPQTAAPRQATMAGATAERIESSRPIPASVTRSESRVPNAANTPAPTPTQSISPSVYLSTAAPWIVLSWALGVLALAFWNLGGWVAVHQLKSLTTRPAGSRAEEAARKLALRLGVSRPVRLLQSTLAKTPMVIGAIRPVILLPASVLTQLSLAELESILAHELAHIRRHDYLVNLVQSMIETLLFYHPATWWISRQIRIERENCCDDLALSITRDRAIYVTALAAVASVRVPLMPQAASGGSLAARLRRGMPDPSTTRSQWLSGAMVSVIREGGERGRCGCGSWARAGPGGASNRQCGSLHNRFLW